MKYKQLKESRDSWQKEAERLEKKLGNLALQNGILNFEKKQAMRMNKNLEEELGRARKEEKQAPVSPDLVVENQRLKKEIKQLQRQLIGRKRR